MGARLRLSTLFRCITGSFVGGNLQTILFYLSFTLFTRRSSRGYPKVIGGCTATHGGHSQLVGIVPLWYHILFRYFQSSSNGERYS